MATKIRSGDIAVGGLAEASKVLRKLDKDLQKQLKEANKDAARVVAAGAKSRALSLGSTAAKSAPSIRASAGYKSAAVGFGGGAYPFGAGAEFGGGRRPTTRQFEPWRGSGPGAGYFVYPTIRADEDRILAAYVAALDRLIAQNWAQ